MLTVGEVLKQKREEKGLSIKDVVDSTYMQSKFIIALECNDYSVFPAEVYTKGFLKNYAELLELDTLKMLELFKNTKDSVVPVCGDEYHKAAVGLGPDIQKITDIEDRKIAIQEAVAVEDRNANDATITTVDIEKILPIVEQVSVAPRADIVETIEVEDDIAEQLVSGEPAEQLEAQEKLELEAQALEQHIPAESLEPEILKAARRQQQPITSTELQQASFRQKLVENRNSGKSKTKTLLTIVLLIAAAVSGYFMIANRGDNSSLAEKSSVINIFKPMTKEDTTQVKSLVLTGKVTARCWVSIVADGKTIFEDNLQPDNTFSWSAKDTLKITIGNVSALTDLKLNNKPADLGPVRNNVVEKTFYLKDVQ